MRAADRQRDLAGVARLSRKGLQQQRPAGNRFASMNRISQTHEQAPPNLDESNAASEQPAALQVLCREPAPAPTGFSVRRTRSRSPPDRDTAEPGSEFRCAAT